jgi:hypothetical protein
MKVMTFYVNYMFLLCFHFLLCVRHCQQPLYMASTKTKLRGLSPQANYTDRATAAVGQVVPTFAGRGCCVVSATNSQGR